MKKIILLICAIFFAVFSSLAYPYSQASAGPLVGGAVPGGIVVGAGAYTVGAYAVAGIVGLAGYAEYEEEINAHAANAWQNGSSLAKSSMEAMVNSAVGAGNALTGVGTDMLNWLQNTYYPDIAATLAGLPPFSTNLGTSVLNTWTEEGGKLAGLQINHSFSNNAALMVNGQKISNIRVSAMNYSTQTYIRVFSGTSQILAAENIKVSSAKAAVSLLRSNSYNPTSTQVAAAVALSGASVSIVGADGAVIPEWLAYDQGLSKIKESWETMRDAGLVLPVDSVTSYVGDTPVRYNPDADTYTNDAGTVFAPADVTHAFPQPRIRTNDVPVPGVYTDTPALTGNPAIDQPLIKNPAIPKTTTNVYTGTTTANPDIAIDTPITPPVTTTPGIPDFGKPGTTGLNFKPLLVSGELLTQKFPFSIPFDFVRQLQVLNVKPEPPKFKIDVQDYLKIGDYTIPFKMDLSFEMFDPIAKIVRWGLILIFDISLIFAIRKLMPE